MCDHSFELESSMQPTYLDVGIGLSHGVLILEVGNLIEVNSQNAHFCFVLDGVGRKAMALQ